MTTIYGKVIWFFSDFDAAQKAGFNRNTVSNIYFRHAAILFNNGRASYENGQIINQTGITFDNDLKIFQWYGDWFGVSVDNIEFDNLIEKYGAEFLEKISGNTSSYYPKNCRGAVDYILLKYGEPLCTRSNDETIEINKLLNMKI